VLLGGTESILPAKKEVMPIVHRVSLTMSIEQLLRRRGIGNMDKIMQPLEKGALVEETERLICRRYRHSCNMGTQYSNTCRKT